MAPHAVFTPPAASVASCSARVHALRPQPFVAVSRRRSAWGGASIRLREAGLSGGSDSERQQGPGRSGRAQVWPFDQAWGATIDTTVSSATIPHLSMIGASCNTQALDAAPLPRGARRALMP